MIHPTLCNLCVALWKSKNGSTHIIVNIAICIASWCNFTLCILLPNRWATYSLVLNCINSWSISLVQLFSIKCHINVKCGERGETTAVLKTNLGSRRENPFPDCRIVSDCLHLLTETKLLSQAYHTGALCYTVKLH